MRKNQKLKLAWIERDDVAVLEPQVLIENLEKSYSDPHSENMFIHNDNLFALKALLKNTIDLTKKIISFFENRVLKQNLYPVGFPQQTCQASTCKPKCGGSFFVSEGF